MGVRRGCWLDGRGVGKGRAMKSGELRRWRAFAGGLGVEPHGEEDVLRLRGN